MGSINGQYPNGQYPNGGYNKINWCNVQFGTQTSNGWSEFSFIFVSHLNVQLRSCIYILIVFVGKLSIARWTTNIQMLLL